MPGGEARHPSAQIVSIAPVPSSCGSDMMNSPPVEFAACASFSSHVRFRAGARDP